MCEPGKGNGRTVGSSWRPVPGVTDGLPDQPPMVSVLAHPLSFWELSSCSWGFLLSAQDAQGHGRRPES